MRYRVHGTSRSTGAPATLRVEAKNHDAARAIAARHLVVAQVEPEGGLAEPEIFERPEKAGLEELIAAVQPDGQNRDDTEGRPRPKSRAQRQVLLAIVLVLALAAVLLAIWMIGPRR
jgi:hypothetical protein